MFINDIIRSEFIESNKDRREQHLLPANPYLENAFWRII